MSEPRVISKKYQARRFNAYASVSNPNAMAEELDGKGVM